MGRIIRIILIIFFSCVLCFSGWKVYTIQSEYTVGENAYSDISQHVTIPSAQTGGGLAASTGSHSSPGVSGAADGEEAEPEDNFPWPQVDFEALREINPDIVGWLYIEGTEINYPVVQSTDNDYYLHHLFNGRLNGAGCLFLDSSNDPSFSDPHSVIYGHYMQNGSMFAGLGGYKKQEFYDEHKTVLLLTPNKNYHVELFSAYVASESSDAWQLNFENDEYADWLAAACESSGIATDVSPTVENRVLTLSTCSYEYSGARLVVLGILK